MRKMILLFSAVLFILGATAGFASAKEEVVSIGFVHGITGPYATYGVPMRDAIDWSLKQIDEKGGFEVQGKKYRLKVIHYDDSSKPETEGPGLLKKSLYSDKVPILLLGGSPITRIGAPMAAQAKTPTIILLAGMANVAKPPYLFRIRPDAAQCAPPLATFFTKDLKAKRIAFLGADTDFSRDNFNFWKQITEKEGGKIISEQWYVPGKVEDFYPTLSKIKADNPDALYISGTTQQNALVYKQASEIGLTVPRGGYTGMTAEQAKNLIGVKYTEALKNVYDSRGIDPAFHPDKKVRDWSKQFSEKFGYFPADLTMWAWDAPFIAIRAFQKAGTVSDREKITKALADLEIPPNVITPYVPLRGNKLFDEQGQSFSTTVVLGWENTDWNTKKYYSVIKGAVKEIK
jgi:branched-chain amino acid transport system substrate-binding protein